MNLTKTGWCLVLAIIALGAGLGFLATRHRRDGLLPDGSRLVVEKVYFGKPQPFEYGGFWERLKRRLPTPLVNRFFKPTTYPGSSSWYNNQPIHTNEDALFIYITRRDALTGAYADVALRDAALVDRHGCDFAPTQSGGQDDGRLSGRGSAAMGGGPGGYSVGWFRFEAFPRNEREFKLQFYDPHGKVEAEYVVHNPAFKTARAASNWVADPMPVTKTIGKVSFTLAAVTIKSNTGPNGYWFQTPRIIEPRYEILEDGRVSSDWQALDAELYDSSGNFASQMPYGRFLCPWESAWKLRVKFFGGERSHSASNAAWTLRGLKIPGPGKFIFLGQSNSLQGVELSALAFAGPGNFQYSNGAPILATPPEYPLEKSTVNSSWSPTRFGGNNFIFRVAGATPHLFISIGDLAENQRLTARATDDQGREVYADEWMQWGQPNDRSKLKPGAINYLERRYVNNAHDAFLAFNLAPDAKIVDVTFCVHACLTPEFIFKPPSGQGTAGKLESGARQKGTNVSPGLIGRTD